ncbi:hypothetical protein DASC09_005250 [Saccharomycopsis crataegensis]|uniref:Uncharacterized protein n=1 Tax=Saccharomycopsis crataegensis TaxID=43959 RepID=A0AAV5QFL6_9ASCO|nr:hypothetical protein DASC09_005250 [Saccharomycopsis crataegensis]
MGKLIKSGQLPKRIWISFLRNFLSKFAKVRLRRATTCAASKIIFSKKVAEVIHIGVAEEISQDTLDFYWAYLVN